MALYCVYYTFAVLGTIFFGGKVTTQSAQTTDQSVPAFYYLMNFNDFGAGIITLFPLMVVNNWFVIVQVYVDITGTRVTRLFFIAFWFFSVMIFLNIVVAFALDIYSSVEESVLKEKAEM
jgi:two pore calcium channel protein